MEHPSLKLIEVVMIAVVLAAIGVLVYRDERESKLTSAEREQRELEKLWRK